jgi:hypothetical protein
VAVSAGSFELFWDHSSVKVSIGAARSVFFPFEDQSGYSGRCCHICISVLHRPALAASKPADTASGKVLSHYRKYCGIMVSIRAAAISIGFLVGRNTLFPLYRTIYAQAHGFDRKSLSKDSAPTA